jgi:hypothetical protein
MHILLKRYTVFEVGQKFARVFNFHPRNSCKIAASANMDAINVPSMITPQMRPTKFQNLLLRLRTGGM